MEENSRSKPKPQADEFSVCIQSLGAAETVTGSKHILYTPRMKIMIDCGLFQGIKSLRLKNWQPLGFDPGRIDAICLTHAHLDHCGYLPTLVSSGYRGKIYMTSPTRALTELILRDRAKLQEEDSWKANHYGYTRHRPALPLYNLKDVERCLSLFEIVDQDIEILLDETISMKYILSGHIPGACSIEFSLYGKKILFSGDIGREHSEFLAAPQHGQPADFVVMESTYGDRLHEQSDPAEQLASTIRETIAKGGNVMIPCFAVGRAQEIIRILYLLKHSGQIPASAPVYLDSPMAVSACAILLRYPQWSTLSAEECKSMMQEIRINERHAGTATIIEWPRHPFGPNYKKSY